MVIYEQIFKAHGLSPTQQKIINLVGKNKTILEIGPSTGYMTKFFLENGCIVDVVESQKEAIRKLPKKIRKVFNRSIEEKNIQHFLNKDYEFIIMADVLEHLVSPADVLKTLKKISTLNTKLLISLPNMACWTMRKQLFFKGDFEYTDSGLLDKTHLHFYTTNTLPKLLREIGWEVKDVIGTVLRLPFEGSLKKIPIFGWMFQKWMYQGLAIKYKNLSYYHFMVIASK